MAEVIARGIDISEHNGVIDWQKVKASGVSFVMLRLGWSWYDGGINLDSRWHDNIQGAAAAGLDIGVYVYSYDKTPEAARIAARRTLEIIKPYQLTYPIAFDMEDSRNITYGKKLNTDICIAFLDEIERAGYYAMLYTGTYFSQAYLDMSRMQKYDVWIADWRSECGYQGSYGIWQYLGDKGACPGVQGACDRNYSYRDYPGIIKLAGLNGKPNEPTLAQLEAENAKLREEIKTNEAVYAQWKENIKSDILALCSRI